MNDPQPYSLFWVGQEYRSEFQESPRYEFAPRPQYNQSQQDYVK